MGPPTSPPSARRPAPRGAPLPVLLPALALLAAGAAGCRQEAPLPAPDVVLVTVDTLRADALGAYGAGPGATPVLDRLAAGGVLFEDAVAPMPLTRPSHFSLFTGRYPREHGVVNNQLDLPEGEVTLAEVFREAGYQTGAFSGTRIFQPSSGAPQGFERYSASETHQEPGAAVVDRALAWLGEVPEGERFFLWVHLYDPHMPYTPPRDLVPAEPPAVPGLERGATWRGLKAIAARSGGGLDEAAARRVRALYDAEVTSADRQVGRLLAALDRRSGPAPVVAVTADHGECFDHGYFYRHSDCLYEGALWVPLVVRAPGRLEAGRRVPGTVELVDLGASLLRLAGLAPPASFRGGDLFANRRGDGVDAYFQPILSDHRAAGERQRIWDGIASVAGEPVRPVLVSPVEPVGVRRGRWKYVLGGTLGEELYDLAADAAERRNLAEGERRRTAELRAAVRRFQREVPFTVLDPTALSPELRESLEALGYL
ncbi:MAG TPA: sulfatase [Thermoanaerobaculia bacterium]|nr:sulfatase [Thermoanaerobaculia bacterium]